MLKKHVFSLFICFVAFFIVQMASAAFNFYYKLSSLSQDVDYLNSALSEILQPAGFELLTSSINISDVIGSPATAQKSPSGKMNVYPLLGKQIQNDSYSLRVVQFSATKTAQIFSGWIYLVIARTDQNGNPLVTLKSQSKKGYSQTWNGFFWHTLSTEEDPLSFQLEVRDSDLHLRPGPKNADKDLPIWAQARPNFPNISSAQIVEYSRHWLDALLQPMKYQLDFNSVDISEEVIVGAGAGYPPASRIIETPEYTLRSLRFGATDSEKKSYTGSLILAIVNCDLKGHSNCLPNNLSANSSIKEVLDVEGNIKANIFLAIDVSANSFPLDIRIQNMNLTPVFTGYH